MSTALLYHGFGIRGYRYLKAEYLEGKVVFHIEQTRERLHCAACGSRHVVLRGHSERLFRHMPIGSREVWIQFAIPRVGCRDCGCVRQVKVPFADPRRRYTRLFARYVLELSRHMTVKHVAQHLRTSWDTVKEIQKTYLIRHYARPPLKHLRQIAIDEIATRKGHVYMTVVLDLESGVVVFVGDGKGADVTDRAEPATADRVIPAKLRKVFLSPTLQHLAAEGGMNGKTTQYGPDSIDPNAASVRLFQS